MGQTGARTFVLVVAFVDCSIKRKRCRVVWQATIKRVVFVWVLLRFVFIVQRGVERIMIKKEDQWRCGCCPANNRARNNGCEESCTVRVAPRVKEMALSGQRCGCNGSIDCLPVKKWANSDSQLHTTPTNKT